MQSPQRRPPPRRSLPKRGRPSRPRSCGRCASARSTTATAVTLAGNGPLIAAKVDETSDSPHRVFLDFTGVSNGSAPAVTPVNNDDIDRVRVAVNSRQPLVTRVVIDLARKIPYTVETVGEELRVLFKKPMATAVETATAMNEPAIAPPIVNRPLPNPWRWRRRGPGC